MSAYVEADYGDHSPPFSDSEQVYSLTEGSFELSKDYEIFDALAGGRNAAMALEDRNPSRAPLFAPRGIPFPCSSPVAWAYFRLIADPHDVPNRHFWPAWRCVSSATAAEWVRDKGCRQSEFKQWFNCEPGGRTWQVVSEPGLHNASWLRLDEFDAAIQHHGLDMVALPVEYRIIREAMSQLTEPRGRTRVRLVIWFS